MKEPKQAVSTRARWYAIAIALGFLLGLVAFLFYYFYVYRPNQKIQQRASLPPHEVSFTHLLSLPDGESRIEGESVIFEGFLVAPEKIGTDTSRWGFDLSNYPSGYLSNAPRASIDRCNEIIKVNCFDFSVSAAVPLGRQEFLNLHVLTDSNEDIRFGNRVRLHGKLFVKNEKFGEHARLDSIIAVTKIEKPK
ncbi:MAG TPA: hypothetical protein VFZ40_20735 [Pyrinomonadaceae bacterium]